MVTFWTYAGESGTTLSLFMLCLVSLLHHRMVEGQMSVWSQMALLHVVEYLQKTVF